MDEHNYFYERNVYVKNYVKNVCPPKLTDELGDENVRALYHTDSVVIQFLDYLDVKKFENITVEGITTKTLIREFVEDLDGNEVTIDTTDVDTIVANHECSGGYKSKDKKNEENTAILWSVVQRLRGDI